MTSFELIARFAYDITVGHGLARAPLAGDHPWYVLIEASSQIEAGFDEALRRRARSGVRGRASSRTRRSPPRSTSATSSGSCASRSRRRRSTKAARSSTTSRSRSATSRPLSTKRRSAVEAFEPGARVCAFGHLGDGNIHFNVSQPLGADTAGLPRPLGRDERSRARDRRAHGRLVLGRARRRAAEARPARRDQGPRRRSRSCARSRRRSIRTG